MKQNPTSKLHKACEVGSPHRADSLRLAGSGTIQVSFMGAVVIGISTSDKPPDSEECRAATGLRVHNIVL